MNRRAWTDDEDARLLRLRALGKTFEWIAVDLSRPTSSIASRLNTLKVKRAREAPPAPLPSTVGRKAGVKNGGRGEARPRKCLCCGKEFASAHAGNRLCPYCRTKSVSPYATAI